MPLRAEGMKKGRAFWGGVLSGIVEPIGAVPVSYTHLDVYKRQVYERTGDVVLTYRGSRKDAVALLAAYRFDNAELELSLIHI